MSLSASAPARGGPGRGRVRFGRKPKLSDFRRKETLSRRGNGETLAQIARIPIQAGCSAGINESPSL